MATLQTAIERATDEEAVYTNGSGGAEVGLSTTDKIGFYGATPIVQRSGAQQFTSRVGTASSSDVTTQVKAALIEVMDTLKTLKLWKGSD